MFSYILWKIPEISCSIYRLAILMAVYPPKNVNSALFLKIIEQPLTC